MELIRVQKLPIALKNLYTYEVEITQDEKL